MSIGFEVVSKAGSSKKKENTIGFEVVSKANPMIKNFDSIVDKSLNPTKSDLKRIIANQTVQKVQNGEYVAPEKIESAAKIVESQQTTGWAAHKNPTYMQQNGKQVAEELRGTIQTVNLDSEQKGIDYLEQKIKNAKTVEAKITALKNEIATMEQFPWAASANAEKIKSKKAELVNLESAYKKELNGATIGDLENLKTEKQNKFNKEKRKQENAKFITTAQSDKDYNSFNSADKRFSKDKTYKFINNIENFRATETDYWARNGTYTNDSSLTFSAVKPAYLESNYEYMTEEEIKTYNYYYAKFGKEKANEYLGIISDILESRHTNKMAEESYQLGKDSPVGASLASVPLKLASSMEQIKLSAEYLITGDMQTNDYATIASSMRQGVSDTVDWEIGEWDAFDFIYNTAMSGVDSLVVAPMGTAGAVALGLSAAADTTNDIISRGGTNGQAFWGGVAAGTFEGFFEKFSIGNLRAMQDGATSGFKEFAKNTVKSMITNATEETATEIANILYDTAMNGGISNYNQMIEQYIANGDDEKTARTKAAKQIGLQIVEAGASGLLMGFGFGVIGSTLGYKNAKSAGKLIVRNNNSRSLIDLGLTLDENTEAHKTAEKLSQNKNSSAAEIGALAFKIKEAAAEQKNNAIKSVVAQRAQALGANSVQASELSDYFAESVQGTKTLEQKIKRIGNTSFAKQIAAEIKDGSAPWVAEMNSQIEAAEQIEQVVTDAVTKKYVSPAENSELQSSANGGVSSDVDGYTLSAEQGEGSEIAAPAALSDKGSGAFNNNKRHRVDKVEQDAVLKVCKALGVKAQFEHINRETIEKITGKKYDGELPDGYYDPNTKTIHLGFAAVNPIKFVFKHELTHFGEGTEAYEKFVKAVKKSKAFKKWLVQKTGLDPNSNSLQAMIGSVRQDQIDRRKGVKNIEVGEADAEVVADFVAGILFREDGSGLEAILSDLEVKDRNAIIRYLRDFFAYLKKKLSDNKDISFEISRLEDNFNRMLSEAVQTQKNTAENSGVKMSFAGYAADGKGKYKSNFPKGTPKTAKAEKILSYIQNVWSKNPIKLKIEENGKTQYIEAKFDPTYDETENIPTDASKIMGGNRHGTASEQRVTLDLADDYYQIASESQYNYSKDETGKDNPAHKDVTRWHYFINDIYFAEYDSEEYAPYRVSINVKEKPDGEYVYSFSAEKQIESNTPRTLHAVVNEGENPNANVELFNNRVSQNEPIVNNNSTQEGEKNSKNIQFSFAKADNMSLVAQAEQMESQGADREQIWEELGLIRDAGGVWIYEIDDSEMVFYPNGDIFVKEDPDYKEYLKLDKKKHWSEKDAERYAELDGKLLKKYEFGKPILKNYLKHDKLYEKYPQLKETIISFKDFQGKALGIYEAKNNTIFLDYSLQGEGKNIELTKTMIHEIQHAIQHLDDRENGSSVEFWNARLLRGERLPINLETGKEYTPKEAYEYTAGEIEARETADRYDYSEKERRYSMFTPDLGWDNAVLVSEYMSAVASGNMESAQAMVDEAAKANGYTERLYHQTGADFTEFNTDNQVAGKYDWELPTGTFLKPTDRDIGLKGQKQMELYAKIKNPLTFENRQAAQRFWSDNVPEYREAVKEIRQIDAEYRQKVDNAEADVQQYMREWRNANPEASRREIYNDAEFQKLYDIQQDIIEEWSAKNDKASLKAKKLIDGFMKNCGFDGIVVTKDAGAQGRSTKTYIVFDSSQLKDASPVTYDDNGNAISLSERFDGSKKDIRFSMPKFSIPTDTAALLEKYDSGEITREEYQSQLDDLWGNALEEYGFFPAGEKAKLPLPIPQKVGETKPVERFIRTVVETGKLTSEMIEDVEQAILLGDTYSYKMISDESATKKADGAIANGTAENQWIVAVETRNITKDDIAIGEKLLLQAIESNDRLRVLELSAELADALTRAGQVVQAARLLKKMSGIGRLVTAQRNVKTLNKSLKEKYGEKVPKVTINPALAKQLAESKNIDDINMVHKEILQDVASQVPPTWLDKFNAWRYFAMLANPRTHIRNLISNTVFMPSIVLKRVIATGMERMFIKDFNQRTKTIVLKQEYREFAKKDIKNREVQNALQGKGQLDEKSAIAELRRTFKSDILENITQGNTNLLEAEDMLYKSHHYRVALASFLQARKVDLKTISEDTLMAAREYAANEAKKATFQDMSKLANWLNSIKNPIGKLAVEGVLPFKRTPINIIKRGVEYSPLGLAEKITRGLWQVRKGNITVSEFCDGFAAGLTGTGLVALGWVLGAAGWVVGGFGDDEEDKFKQLNGEQEYSLIIGGKSYTIDWSAPACLPFFIGVELAEEIAEGDSFEFKDLTESIWNTLEPVTNLSMLSGVQGLIDTVRYEDGSKTIGTMAGDIATTFAMQFIPSFLGATARTIDSKQRSWYTDKNSPLDSFTQSVIDNVKSKVPGLSFTQIPKIDAWGREVSRGNVGERILENFVSPGYYSAIDYNETDEELKSLFVKTGGKVFPKTAAKSFELNGETKYLTADEYVTFAKAKGEYSYEYIHEFMEKNSYKSLTDEERVKVIEGLYEYANAKAKTTISNYDLMKRYKTVTKWERNGRSAVDYYISNAIEK